MNFEAALKYPFNKENWKKPFLIMFGLYFIVLGLPSLVQLPGQILSIMGQDTSWEGSATGVYAISTFGAFAISMLSLPLAVYISGYLMRIYNSVRNDEKNVPEHTNIWETTLTGLKLFVLGLVYGGIPAAVFAFFGVIALVSFGVGLGIGEDVSIGFGVLGGLISGFLALLALIVVIIMSVVVMPAVYYEFVRNNYELGAAFNLERIKQVVKVGAGDFLMAWLVIVAIGVAVSIAMIVSCCLAFIVQPLAQTYLVYMSGSIYGNVFRELDMKLAPAKAVTKTAKSAK